MLRVLTRSFNSSDGDSGTAKEVARQDAPSRLSPSDRLHALRAALSRFHEGVTVQKKSCKLPPLSARQLSVTPQPTDELLAEEKEMETARRRGERLCPSTSGFTTFKSERFRSISASSMCPIRQWLNYLPQRDSHKRFSGPALKSLILRLERRLEEMRDPDWYTPQAILERVIQANAREGRDVPQKLRDDILACPLTPLPDDQTLALLLYSAELYVDEASVPPQPAPFQLYSELNRICREYAHADSPDADLKADWELFRPFAAHLQAAISALPKVQTTLYRGASYAIDAEVFRSGVRGSWGGLVSASSDRRQAVSFVSREAGLQSSDGSYFIITADAARPIYHLSEFPAEMEYLHPLDLELEVVSFVPFFLLTKASVNSSVAILKRAGLDLSFEASLGVRSCITYVLEEFFSTYIVPPVKPKLEDEPSPIDDHIQDFLRSSDHTLFVTGESGIGKSSLAIWLTNHGEHEGWTFLYCCVGCLLDPLETGAFLRALSYKYGFGDRANREIRSRRIVVVIDNFYINTHGRPTLHAANGLSTNDFKLILVCRQHQLQEYRDWCGPQSRQLLLQPFNDDNIAQFIGLRVRDSASPERRVSSRLSRPDTGNVARVSTGPAEDTVLQQLRDLRFWEQCRLPSILRMVTDLSLADPRILPTLPTLFEFNVRWLSWHCKSRGSDDVEADLRRAESLAWEVQGRNGFAGIIGDRANAAWFRRLPLLVAVYTADSTFVFHGQILKDAMVASHILHQLSSRSEVAFLDQVPVFDEPGALQFFGEAYHSLSDPRRRDTVRMLLGRVCTGPPPVASGPTAGHLVANAASLMCALDR